MSTWGTWHVETAWGWRSTEDTPELVTAWDSFSVDANETGFREAIDRDFADNQIDTRTLRRVRLKVNGDDIMALYEALEVEVEAEAVDEIADPGVKEVQR